MSISMETMPDALVPPRVRAGPRVDAKPMPLRAGSGVCGRFVMTETFAGYSPEAGRCSVA